MVKYWEIDLKCASIRSRQNVTFGPKSNVYTILKIAVNWWRKVVGPQNWNGKFFDTWGSKSVLQKFRTGADSVRNFCRFRIAKKHRILRKTPHFETALSFSMFKRARGVKKIFFAKTHLENLRKKMYGKNPKTHRLTPFRSTQPVFLAFLAF